MAASYGAAHLRALLAPLLRLRVSRALLAKREIEKEAKESKAAGIANQLLLCQVLIV